MTRTDASSSYSLELQRLGQQPSRIFVILHEQRRDKPKGAGRDVCTSSFVDGGLLLLQR